MVDQAKPSEAPKRRYFFEKGNKYKPTGKPNISLRKPDILLPSIFLMGKVNWSADLVRMYKKMRGAGKSGYSGRKLNETEQILWNTLLDLLPYLVSKITLKEIDLKKLTDPSTSVAQAHQTSLLLKALEQEGNKHGTKPGADTVSEAGSVAIGTPVLPPASQSTDNLR